MPSLSASSNQSENYEVQQDGYDLLGSEVDDSMTFEFEASRLDNTVTTGSAIEKFKLKKLWVGYFQRSEYDNSKEISYKSDQL